MLEKLEQIEARYEALTAELSSGELLANKQAYAKAAKQHRHFGEIIEKYRRLKTLRAELDGARDIADNADDEEMR